MGKGYKRWLGWGGAGLALAVLGGIALTPYFKGNLIVNPALIQLGGFTIYWYGLTMAAAALAAFSWWRVRARGVISETDAINLSIWVVLTGLVGARALFVILKLPDFAAQPWWETLNLHGGGLSIHGALLFGAITVWWWARRWRLPVITLFDRLIPPVILGQIIGRLGNFFNQEAFGGPTDLPWQMWLAPANRPTGFADQAFFHPTFLYSMIGLSLVLVIVLWAERRWRHSGVVLLAYLIAYSIERFFVEFFRIDSDKWNSLTLAQWASLLVIMSALVIGLIWRYNLKKPR